MQTPYITVRVILDPKRCITKPGEKSTLFKYVLDGQEGWSPLNIISYSFAYDAANISESYIDAIKRLDGTIGIKLLSIDLDSYINIGEILKN